MRGTDELREWAKTLTHWWYDPVKDEYTYTTGTMPPSIDAIRLDSNIIAIADRIDAEHERELRETGEDIVRDVRREWVRLPLDADGVPIHVGDVMEYTDKPTEPLTVSCIELEEKGWWVFAGGMGRRPDKYRHYHAPTVEDVLRGVVTLCHNTWKEGSAFEFYDVDDVMKSGNIAEYAAKLRLAEGGEDA